MTLFKSMRPRSSSSNESGNTIPLLRPRSSSLPKIGYSIAANHNVSSESLQEQPSDYLAIALEQQGLKQPPENFKQPWEDEEKGYKYEVRIHPGDSRYTEAAAIYRVMRQSLRRDEHGQGSGKEYLGSDGIWHNVLTLQEKTRAKLPNPKYNERAAKSTHIPLN